MSDQTEEQESEEKVDEKPTAPIFRLKTAQVEMEVRNFYMLIEPPKDSLNIPKEEKQED
jgi:hypothetical protein